MPKATLTLDTKKRNCLSYSFDLQQSTDHYSGKPASEVHPLSLSVSFKSQEEPFPFDLMVDPTKKVEGTLEIMNSEDINKPLRTLKFSESYVIHYSESGSNADRSDSIITISIVCRKVELGNVPHDLTGDYY